MVPKMYEESSSENDNVQENEKGDNKKKTKELAYTNIGSYKRGEWAKQWEFKKPKDDHEIPRNQEKMKSSCHQGNDSFQSGKEHFYR